MGVWLCSVGSFVISAWCKLAKCISSGSSGREHCEPRTGNHRLPLKPLADFTNPRRRDDTPHVPVMLIAQKELTETAPGASGLNKLEG